MDRETVLNSSDLSKTNKKVKDAQVYKNDNNYYYRDTLHVGERAHLEVFNKRGIHIGEADPITGKIIEGTAEPAESSMIFSNNHLEIEFLNKIIVDSNIYTLGDKISEKIESNYILENKFFFAFNKDTKLNALSENKTIIGWNKNNRIVFISSENEKAKTTLNVGVGDTEEDVYKKYGEPTTKGNNCYRYENYEYEFMGLVFYFENKKVYRIVSFSSI